MLRRMGLDPYSVNPSEIRADYEMMKTQKTTLEQLYRVTEKEASSLKQKLDNIEQYMGQRLENDAPTVRKPRNTAVHSSKHEHG